MCNALIASRLMKLNQQLMTISKLQEMEETFKTGCHVSCKKDGFEYDGIESVQHKCRCNHHASQFTVQCPKCKCTRTSTSKDGKNRFPCNADACRTKRKFCCCTSKKESTPETNINGIGDSQLVRDNVEDITDHPQSEQNRIQRDEIGIVETQSDAVDKPQDGGREILNSAFSRSEIAKDKEEETVGKIDVIEPMRPIGDTNEFSNEERNTNKKPQETDGINLISYAASKKKLQHDRNDVEHIPTREHEQYARLTEKRKEENKKKTENKKKPQDHSSREEKDTDYNKISDKRSFERIQKDLLNEKKRTEELEEKLKSVTCSLQCLKEDSERKAACLELALRKAEEQAQSAEASKNITINVEKQAREQTDLFKAEKDKMINEIAVLKKDIGEIQCKYTSLSCECENLKCKLQEVSEVEAKKCAEVSDEVNRMKCVFKEKENALDTKNKELRQLVVELTKTITIQKKRICELTGICNKQQTSLQQREHTLVAKNSEICEAQSKLELATCKCTEMREELDKLKATLEEERNTCNCCTQELERLKENYFCEIRIKEKIIENQSETIKKQKKLLQESQKMVQQTACEFDRLKDELYCERQTNHSLQDALDIAERRLNEYTADCRNCDTLEREVDCVKQQKQKALYAAKYAMRKLCESSKDYEQQLACNKKQHRFLTLVLKKKEEEINCLKKEIFHRDNQNKYRLSNCFV